ncbi:MAG: 30S ribosomal protein S17 [Chitinivibrionales bacterium]|nr:30S ribosomal protein S17 [Chitinivibrionales bacterium]
MSERNARKTRIGTVVSDKMEKSVVVNVQRQITHSKYGKIIRENKRYVAHDEQNECSIGDKVRIIETRPLSKTKRWRVGTLLTKAQ